MSSKQLKRGKEKIIGGIASGIAEYFNIDPLLIRLLFIIFTLFWGCGIWLYIILLIIMPKSPKEATSSNEEIHQETDITLNPDEIKTKLENKNNNTKFVIGGIFIITGLLLLIKKYIINFGFDLFLPILFIFLGIFIIFININSNKNK